MRRAIELNRHRGLAADERRRSYRAATPEALTVIARWLKHLAPGTHVTEP